MNLMPCLTRTCKREDEGIQETLLQAMMKICPALMVFATDTEVKVRKQITNMIILTAQILLNRTWYLLQLKN